MPVQGPHNRPTLERAEWVARAIKLYTKGWTYREIATDVAKHHETVRQAILDEFRRVRPSDDELRAARELHREKLHRRERKLNTLTDRYLPRAKTGDHEAAKVVIDAERLLDRVHLSMARLDGLDAPTKSELTGADGAPIMIDTSGMSLDDIAKLLAATDPGAEGGAEDAAAGGPREEDRGE